MKRVLREITWWTASTLLMVAVAIGVHYLFAADMWSFDLCVALGLLAVNQTFFGVATRLQTRPSPVSGMKAGLIWIAAKLFVNTFTIFLLIGLHAVRSSVFVPVFFIAYAVVLFLGILRLNLFHPTAPPTDDA